MVKIESDKYNSENSGCHIDFSMFGSTQLGQSIKEWIRLGQKCEAQINGKPCGEPAIGTIDYDVIGEVTSNFVCSEKHFYFIQEVVIKDLRKIGRLTVIGYNGNGRD